MHFDSYFDIISMVFDAFSMVIQYINRSKFWNVIRYISIINSMLFWCISYGCINIELLDSLKYHRIIFQNFDLLMYRMTSKNASNTIEIVSKCIKLYRIVCESNIYSQLWLSSNCIENVIGYILHRKGIKTLSNIIKLK